MSRERAVRNFPEPALASYSSEALDKQLSPVSG